MPEKLVHSLQCEGLIILLYAYKVLLQKKTILLLMTKVYLKTNFKYKNFLQVPWC